MSDLNVRRWTGAFGLAIVALLLIEFPFRVALGVPPLLEDAARYADYVSKTSGSMLTIIVIDMFMMACILVFLAGFRHLIQETRVEYEWVGTLVFGTGLVLVAITLVADSMEGGAALDTIGGRADPSAIRALTEGYLLMFGSIGCILFALLSAATGYATLATGVLPRWTGWLSYAVAILNLAAIPRSTGGPTIQVSTLLLDGALLSSPPSRG
jgi:succinate dehydrogenase/fumarate reductase cytochrome b subunit